MPPERALLTPREVRETGLSILSAQSGAGLIAWEHGRHGDPWNHVEAAMALDVAGFPDAAGRAYGWLAGSQRADGSWGMAYRDDRIEDHAADANFCAYPAAGVWHHFLAGGGRAFLERLWPAVERSIDFVLALQAPGGEIHWARDGAGVPWPAALLTSSSCIHLSLGCAIRIAAEIGVDRPAWEAARLRLRRAISLRPAAFEPRRRYAMDWYYPVLSGALGAGPGGERLDRGWDEFVVEGWGVRCVSDRPWVTVAETCELVIALDVAGRPEAAAEVLGWTRRLRDANGSYWTGITCDTGETWPLERPTWTSGAVLLAGDSLRGVSATSGFFRDAALTGAGEELEAAG